VLSSSGRGSAELIELSCGLLLIDRVDLTMTSSLQTRLLAELLLFYSSFEKFETASELLLPRSEIIT
jgi:hypothetical protein